MFGGQALITGALNNSIDDVRRCLPEQEQLDNLTFF